MLSDRLQPFYDAVHAAISVVGNSAPRIADRVIAQAFPETSAAAEREGAYRMLRNGVISFITKYLKRQHQPCIDQIDFAEIAPGYQNIVKKLSNPAHYVEGLGEYMPVADLIAHPDWLNDARAYKRRSGLDTLAEADVLDELYDAITHQNTEA